MIRFRTILVPVDFSDHSTRALDYALGLAEACGARIHLLHCCHVELLDLSAHDPPYVPELPQDFYAPIREAAARRLEDCRQRVARRGVGVEAELSDRDPSDGILRAAQRLRPDLIVMGTRGLTGLQHVLLGSVAERTVRNAPCAVLTVKAECPLPDRQ